MNLGMYSTPNRLYDPTIGRFQGMDKLSDMFTSVSPMIFGFNNPLKFKDPTGLSGDCDGCVELQEVVVRGTRLPETVPNYSALLNQLTKRSNPVFRNLGHMVQKYGLGQANQMIHRGSILHYSPGEALQSRNSGYLDGIRAMVSFGITGSIVAAAANPMLIETLAPIMASKTGIDMTVEATWQAGNSLLFNGNLSQWILRILALRHLVNLVL
ncbi:hypothetical protein [Mongoliitalea daihaiensis]|uniref:hypothetical protein n=1 Tax=Mongoliitalea daihaiensis TaxID=2782006 RepID=UPI001F1FBD68|nr:hypothetical protein [Mongoliitalea daihaiensis]